MRQERMNTDFWLRLFLAALIVIGVWNAFGKGMIFGWLGDWFEAHVNEHLLKPIFLCPCCMASVWGSLVWFLTGGDLYYWPFFVIALSGFLKFIPISYLQK